MTVLAPPAFQAFSLPPYPVRRFTVEEYHRLIRDGYLNEDDPVELLEGWLALKMPHNPPHDGTIEVAEEVLRPRLPSGWKVRVQSAITLPDSEPEPDLAIVRGSARSHLHQHPGPDEIGLLIEVAESTLERDRKDKSRLYARARIPVYWIINLIDRQIEVYSEPSGPVLEPSYARRQDYRPADAVPLTWPDVDLGSIGVSDLLP